MFSVRNIICILVLTSTAVIGSAIPLQDTLTAEEGSAIPLQDALTTEEAATTTEEVTESELTTTSFQETSTDADFNANTETISPTSSTTGSSIVRIQKVGCFIDGQRYFEGQYLPEAGGNCKSCYCLKGEPHCTDIKCRSHKNGCKPILVEGKCCPVRYECDEEVSDTTSAPKEDSLKEKTLTVGSAVVVRDQYDVSGVNLEDFDNHVRIDRQSRTEEITTVQPEPEPTDVSEPIAEPESEPVPEPESEPAPEPEPKSEPEPEPETTAALESSDLKEVEATAEPETDIEPTQQPEPTAETEPESSDKPELSNNIKDSEPEVKSIPKDLFSESLNGKTELDNNVNAIFEEESTPSDVPSISLSDILFGNGNEDSLAVILPDPITGTNTEHVFIPEKNPIDVDPERETVFPSYDINVGSSIFAGDQNTKPMGVGQVIPVDLRLPDSRFPPRPIAPPRRPTQSPAATSFLDSLLTFFGGSNLETRDENIPSRPISPPFSLNRPPPFLNGMRPPPIVPPPYIVEYDENILGQQGNEARNDIENEVDFLAIPSVDNEVTAEATKLPSTGSATRNELPIRRRPGATGGRPLRPGLFASRPNLPISRPPLPNGQPKLSDDNLEGFVIPARHEDFAPESNFPGLPNEPFVEGGFFAIRDNETVSPAPENENPSDFDLPPSLPNLQIIPFVAADAVVNHQDGINPEDFRSTPRPFALPILEGCREGGKIWQNGETVARGNANPCVLCRCLSGKVICQQQKCPEVPAKCTSTSASEGECCPKIDCDESSNVSIVDILPSFHPIEEEKKPEQQPITTTAASPSTRRSVFNFKPRRPTADSDRRKKLPPIISSKPSILDNKRQERPTRPARPDRPTRPERPTRIDRPIRRPIIPPRLRKPSVSSKEDKPESEASRRPIRPSIARPKPLRPRTDSDASSPSPIRPPFSRPFTNQSRTGTRPPFIPPRNPNIRRPELPNSSILDSPITTSFPQISSSEQLSSLRPSDLPRPLRPTSPSRLSLQELLALSAGGSSSTTHKENESFLPPGLLLPKPIPTSSPDIDDVLKNFVNQSPPTSTTPRPPRPTTARPSRPTPTTTQRPLRTTTTKSLPEIPDFVKAQMPLGNDPMLALGLIELAGCDVYGRLYDVGESIKELSGECKACQCTKVGVQCLPIC